MPLTTQQMFKLGRVFRLFNRKGSVLPKRLARVIGKEPAETYIRVLGSLGYKISKTEDHYVAAWVEPKKGATPKAKKATKRAAPRRPAAPKGTAGAAVEAAATSAEAPQS